MRMRMQLQLRNTNCARRARRRVDVFLTPPPHTRRRCAAASSAAGARWESRAITPSAAHARAALLRPTPGAPQSPPSPPPFSVLHCAPPLPGGRWAPPPPPPSPARAACSKAAARAGRWLGSRARQRGTKGGLVAHEHASAAPSRPPSMRLPPPLVHRVLGRLGLGVRIKHVDALRHLGRCAAVDAVGCGHERARAGVWGVRVGRGADGV